MKGAKTKNEASSTLKKVDDKKIGKRKSATSSGSRVAKKGKKDKDPNRPKRPPSAFFVFMEEFRKTFKEKNPNNRSVAAVGKAGGEKWKQMSEADKAPYVTKAAKRKQDYEKNMSAYNKKQAGEAEDESDKSKSEVNDEEDESGEEEEDDD